MSFQTSLSISYTFVSLSVCPFLEFSGRLQHIGLWILRISLIFPLFLPKREFVKLFVAFVRLLLVLRFPSQANSFLVLCFFFKLRRRGKQGRPTPLPAFTCAFWRLLHASISSGPVDELPEMDRIRRTLATVA